MPNNCVKWSDFISIFVLFYLSRLFFLKLNLKGVKQKQRTANSILRSLFSSENSLVSAIGIIQYNVFRLEKVKCQQWLADKLGVKSTPIPLLSRLLKSSGEGLTVVIYNGGDKYSPGHAAVTPLLLRSNTSKSSNIVLLLLSSLLQGVVLEVYLSPKGILLTHSRLVTLVTTVTMIIIIWQPW